MIPLILSIGIAPALSFAQSDTSGCKEGDIYLKNPTTGDVVCEKQSRAQKMVKEGWVAQNEMPGRATTTSQCQDGKVKLKNPTTGDIICEKASQAKNLVAQGWLSTHAPHKQTANNVLPHEVVCNDTHKLVIRDSGKANCVKPDTHDKMLAVGIGAKPVDVACDKGNIYLKSPNTGAIVCEQQSKAAKYVKEGWIALDEIPETSTGITSSLCQAGEIRLKNPNTGDILCEKANTAAKYVKQGYIALDEIPGMQGSTTPLCQAAEIKLKVPNTGDIICEKASQAKKLVSEGYIALDEIPGTQTSTTPLCRDEYVYLKNPTTGESLCADPSKSAKYLKEGWTRTEPMTVAVDASEVNNESTMHKHMAAIETVTVVVESKGAASNVYQVTYKVTAGSEDLKNITIHVSSDKEEKVIGTVSSLAADSSTGLQIRIHALDANSIHGMIANYNLK